jgi:hypothetical protein
MIGAIVALCHFGFAVAPRPRSFPLLLCCAAMLYFVAHEMRTIRIHALAVTKLSEQMHLLEDHAESPLALSDITIFHQVSFYSPRRIIQNVAYVANAESSVKYLQQDTVDRGLLDLRPWFPLQIVPSQTFLAEHREFLIYSYIGAWSWLTYELLPPHYETRMLQRYNSDILLSTRRTDEAPQEPSDKAEQTPPSDELFRRVSSDGPSLCIQWMPHDSFCKLVEQKRQKALQVPLIPRQSIR